MIESVQVETGAYGTRYLGCGTALTQAGIVRPEQLPGASGPRKTSAVYYDGLPVLRGRSYPRDERYVRVKLVGRDRFEVWVPCSKEQRALQDDANARALHLMAEQDRARLELSRLPGTRDAYRAISLSTVDSFLGAALFCLEATDRHGYSFDFNTRQQVKAAAARLIATLQNGSVTFDGARNARAVAELRERAGLPPELPRLRVVAGTDVTENAR